MASECKGFIKLGNDGKQYISKPDPNNVYKWTKLVNATHNATQKKHQRRKRIYKIRDRGGYPFNVFDYGTKVAVYDNTNDNKIDTCVAKGKAKGNTILLEKKDGHFVFVGPKIMEFSLKHGDKIRAFYSPVCNSSSDKSYPYAVGRNYTYLFDAAGDDGVTCVPNEKLDVRKNVYSPPQPVPSSKTLVQRRW